MSRSISAGLLAAAQSLRGVPSVVGEIRDERLRWREIEDHGHTSVCPVRMDCATQIIWRARCDGSGNMQYQKVTNDGVTSQWQAWTTVTPALAAYADVAIGADSPLNARLFYPSGTQVYSKETTDGGSTWGSATSVGAPGASPLVACSGCYVVHWSTVNGNLTVCHKAIGSGSWSTIATWAVGSTNEDGLGSCVKYTANLLYVAVCYDGILSVRSVNTSTGVWGDEIQVEPPWGAVTPEDWYPANCDIDIMEDDDMIVTWVDHRDTVDPTWEVAVCRRSKDGINWGQDVALGLVWSTERTVAVCANAHTDDRYFYAGVEQMVMRSRSFKAGSSDQNITGLEIIDYEYAGSGSGSAMVSADILDRDGTLKGLADEGEAAEAVNLLSELHIERGYVLSTGAEREALPPLLIVGAAYTVGEGGGVIHLDATDTLGLMDRVSLRRPLAAAGLTFAELAQRLVAQVGFEFSDDGDAAFDRAVTSFQSPPGATLGSVFRRLMGLCGAVYRVDENGDLYAIQYGAYSVGSPAALGDKDEILRGEFGLRLPRATRVIWAGDSSTAWEDTGASMRLGARLEWHVVDHHANSTAIVEDAAEGAGLLAVDQMDRDRVVVHVRPDLELWDVVDVTTDTDVLPAATGRVIVAVRERYSAVRGRFEGSYTLQAE